MSVDKYLGLKPGTLKPNLRPTLAIFLESVERIILSKIFDFLISLKIQYKSGFPLKIIIFLLGIPLDPSLQQTRQIFFFKLFSSLKKMNNTEEQINNYEMDRLDTEIHEYNSNNF